MKISVFGLGIIGAIWSRHHAAAGLLAAAWNRSPKPGHPGWEPDALAATRAADVLQIVVADPEAVAAVLDAILPALGPGRLVVQSSTIDPDSSDRFRSLVEGRGAGYVEAPFTGSKPAAEARKTVFYLGGASEAVRAAEPALANLSEVWHRVGTNRQASALKLAMNLQIAAILQSLCEGLAFARRAGLSDAVFFDALKGNAAFSGVARLKEPKLRAADFAPQFSVKHMHKDLRLALGAAGGREYPGTEAARSQLRRAEERGWGDEDFSAILKLL